MVQTDKNFKVGDLLFSQRWGIVCVKIIRISEIECCVEVLLKQTNWIFEGGNKFTKKSQFANEAVLISSKELEWINILYNERINSK